MSPIILVLILLFLAIILFATEKIPVDVVGIILIVCLVMTGVLTTKEALLGFGDEIIITIGGLFVLTGSLVKTGLIDLIGRKLFRIAGSNEFLLVLLIMLVGSVASTFMNNTTAAAMLIPFVLGLAERANVSPSKLLMPLAFGTIMGGSCLLIGTSTNLAVSGSLDRYGMQPFSMFELTPVGVIVALLGILYMMTIGRRLLPDNRKKDESLTARYRIREYISEVLILPTSNLVGKTLGQANFQVELDLSVIGIIRDNKKILTPGSEERLEAGDLLIVEGVLEKILSIKAEYGLKIKPDAKFTEGVLENEENETLEVLIMKDSKLAGQTLTSLNFRQNYDLTVLAINRHGEKFIEKMSEEFLNFGDVLLVQGNSQKLEPLVADRHILLLQDVTAHNTRAGKRKWAITAFAVFLSLSLSKSFIGIDMPLAMAVIFGVLILLGTRTVRYSELYSMIDFRLLVLIACMMSFGIAMEKSGTDRFLADLIVTYFSSFGPTAVLGGFFILTVLLTQPMSNQAAALVVLPIAIKTAVALGLNPRTFVVAITYAASFSFMTPLEPACVLVYTPGGYKFMDFVKIGTILTILVFIVAILLVPVFWKL